MNILISLDYEVFFGHHSGTVSRNILEPTEALRQIAERHGARLCLFVDAGFLWRLEKHAGQADQLKRDLDSIRWQLSDMVTAGHEVQLHIHPHWEDSPWSGNGWDICLDRYSLHRFGSVETAEIVRRYYNILAQIAGAENVIAYRAGGWVIQPFAHLATSLATAGIKIDSTVYPHGTADSKTHWFDFRGAPEKSKWRFDNDPLIEVSNGKFLELPISSHRLTPDFFWRFAAIKKFGSSQHKPWGDGHAVPMGKSDMLKKLLRPSHSVVSIDGYKSAFLRKAYIAYRQKGMSDFVIIGHPKATTDYSLSAFDEFLASLTFDRFVTFLDYVKD
ncbi:MAG: hypothetical protein KIT82_00655 [Bradyrhizobium sp.]|nr:hypothetical protein [Bradyrhizobium sp.]